MGLIIPPVVTALNVSTYTASTMQESLTNKDITLASSGTLNLVLLTATVK